MTQEENFKYRVVDGFDSERAEWFDGEKWVGQRLEEVVDALNYAEQLCGTVMAENKRLLAEVERLRAELAEAAKPSDAEIIRDNDRLRKANTAAIAALLTLANEENWENRGGHMTWIGSRGNRPMDFAWQAANNITDIEGGEG